MLRTVLFSAVVLFATELRGETIKLGYHLNMGTYTVPVQIGNLRVLDLTFDTGASLTVLRIEDVELLGLRPLGRAGVTFPHQGARTEAYLYEIPEMRIGGCTIHNSHVIGMSIPEGRPGVLGMADLERLSPFTFKGNGQLEITCP